MERIPLNLSQDIEIKDGSIRIRDKINPLSMYPIGVASILPDFQVRIGQKFSLLQECIVKARMPVILRPVYNSNGSYIFTVIRMGSRGTSQRAFGVLTVVDNIVTKYAFDRLSDAEPDSSFSSEIVGMQRLIISLDTADIEEAVKIALGGLLRMEINKESWDCTYTKSTIRLIYKRDEMTDGKPGVTYLLKNIDGVGLVVKSIGYKPTCLLALEERVDV